MVLEFAVVVVLEAALAARELAAGIDFAERPRPSGDVLRFLSFFPCVVNVQSCAESAVGGKKRGKGDASECRPND